MKVVAANSGEKNKYIKDRRQYYLRKKQLHLVHHYHGANGYVDAAEKNEIGDFFYQDCKKKLIFLDNQLIRCQCIACISAPVFNGNPENNGIVFC